MCRQEEAYVVREEFPQALRRRGRTVLAPSGPTRRQEQGSWRWTSRPRPWDSRRGGSTPGRESRGPAGPKAIVDSTGCRRCITRCCCCTSARPSGDAVRRRLHRLGCRRARRNRGGRGRARGLDRISPLSRTSLRNRLGDGHRGSRGFCAIRADLGGYGENRSEIVVGCRQSPPAVGIPIDGGDGVRNKSDKSLRRSRNVVNPHAWPVCAKIAKMGGGETEPTQDSTFGAGH